MNTLFIAIAFSVFAAIFATQNNFLVTLHFGNYYLAGIPIYLVVLFSALIGLLIAWIIASVEHMDSFFAIMRKDSTIDASQQTIHALENRIHELETENAKLRGENANIPLSQRIKTRLIVP